MTKPIERLTARLREALSGLGYCDLDIRYVTGADRRRPCLRWQGTARHETLKVVRSIGSWQTVKECVMGLSIEEKCSGGSEPDLVVSAIPTRRKSPKKGPLPIFLRGLRP